MRPARSDQGFTLIEVVVALTLMLSLFGTALDVFGAFANANTVRLNVNEAQDRVRTATDRLAHDLRNLANPTTDTPVAIAQATGYDLAFQTVDPAGPQGGNAAGVRRVRYCLDESNPANEKLWFQTQTWSSSSTPAVPSMASCPSSGWTTQYQLADSIVNDWNGQSRPVFSYDTSVPSAITQVVTHLDIDVNPGKPPAETQLETAVFLRNQNQPPTAGFTITLVGSAAIGSTHVLLNGSLSLDPEGAPLTYAWFDGSTQITSCGNTVVCDYVAQGSGTHNISLKVFDSGNLEADAAAQVVTVS